MPRCIALGLAACCVAAWSQDARPPDGGIYTCIDDSGQAIRRDRFIAECRHKEQRILNRDGSLRRIVPPTLTPEERAERDRIQQEQRQAQAAQQDTVNFDRLLKTRYPNEAAHQRARATALSASEAAIHAAEARLRELAVERKQLGQEAEFYRGRVVPAPLRQQIEANEGQAEAQRTSIRNVQGEQERINKRFDVELERLRKLWKGAEPGSLGPAPK
jgi:hypothetical protein